MNREIKVRAWDKSLGKFLYPKLWDNSMPSNWEHWYILTQYIGLKDKNKAEVYEGDILSPYDSMDRVLIEFKGGQFVGTNLDKSHPIRETQNRNWFDWVIIGNQFENPELLKN